MEAFSMDLRRRVIEACDQGHQTLDQIARRFRVSVPWIVKLKRRRRESGSIAPAPYTPGPKPVFDPAKLEQLRRLVEQHPDATLAQLRQRMGLDVSLSVIHRALVKLKLTYKKRRCVPPSKTATT